LGKPLLDDENNESPVKELCDSFLTDLPEAPTLNFDDGDDTFLLDPNQKPSANLVVQDA
jgi:hypothetical protein